MKNLNLFFALATCIFMYSCGTTDSDAPTFCSVDGDVAIVDEVEALAGSTLSLNQTVCDNEALGTANWDLHSAEGHAHEGEEEEGFVLFSGSWDYDFSDELSGTSATSGISTDIPNDVRGVWDIVISLVDAEGNIAADVVTPLHIENDFIPEYQLTMVTGLDLAVGGEPVWAPGSTITIEGTLSDSDGIEHWGYHLENEDTEVKIAEDEGDGAGSTEVSFTWTIDIPTGATPGEYHFHMHAHDMLDNAMETGFHVEIE
ncbi:MAG: hypothetical protein CMB32_04205 [Euryarchaeota archaeon]|nr:hypothetical protein [Euryarchaeota archaeon]